MLQSLSVWNFALLEHVEVNFGRGLNILTGETGAGKSILIDALGAVLGHRITVDFIRTGCDVLRIEAVFVFEHIPKDLQVFLEEQALELDEGRLVIRRQLKANGKGQIWINGSHMTLAALKALASFLIDIHGQNENLALLREENHLVLLGSFDEKIESYLNVYRKEYDAWREVCKAYAVREKASRDIESRIDMLRWQDKEITDAKLQENEDKTLERDIERLSHAEKISDFIEESYNLLDNGNREGIGVLPALARVEKDLGNMLRYDSSLENAWKIVSDAYISLQEASYELRDYGEQISFSPEKLNKLQTRMDTLYKLRKKYGATVANVLAYQKKLREELNRLENYDSSMDAMKREIAKRYQIVKERAAAVTKAREEAAKRLGSAIEEQLYALGMPKAKLRIAVEAAETYGKTGHDVVRIYFSANVGQEERPLQKVASGGELSRIALAIKSVSAAHDAAAASMVFDEIDTGIGGRTAQMVAERIACIAHYKQVLCITHLPQIASMADEHLYIAKKTEGDSTVTCVHTLVERERIREIARMASGTEITAASLDNAQEMVKRARIKKQMLCQKIV